VALGCCCGTEGVCGRLKERKSFPFGFLGLFQERGAASPFLLQEGERQLNREREGNGTVCVGKWGEGRRKIEEDGGGGPCLAYFVKAKGGASGAKITGQRGGFLAAPAGQKKRQAPFGLGENQGNGGPLKKR